MLEPERSMESKSASMNERMQKVDDIPVSDWWDVSRPGDYLVGISRRQELPASKKYVVVTTPDVRFRVLAEPDQEVRRGLGRRPYRNLAALAEFVQQRGASRTSLAWRPYHGALMAEV